MCTINNNERGIVENTKKQRSRKHKKTNREDKTKKEKENREEANRSVRNGKDAPIGYSLLSLSKAYSLAS